jgi:ribulose bisphosphate carboxylase small subunit
MDWSEWPLMSRDYTGKSTISRLFVEETQKKLAQLLERGYNKK